MISFMQFQPALLVALIANIVFWLGIFFVERYESQHGLIPPRRKLDERGDGFLYLNDLSTGSWGDYVGFSLVDFGATVGLVTFWENEAVAVAAMGGFIVTFIFYFFNERTSHPLGSLFSVQGKMSQGGKVHLVYYFIQATVSIWSLYALFALHLSSESFYPILLGVTIYLIAFLNDCRLHRFS